MKIGTVDTTRDVLIVAEIGNNHEGNVAVAEELIGRAAETGVQAVKFQTFRTEDFVSQLDPERYERMKRFELSREAFTRLARQAREAGLLFLSTPLDLGSARFLEPLVDAYKIASGDNDFHPLIEAAATTGKPLILSTGLADLGVLDHSVACIRKLWHDQGITQDLALLHCVTAYPVPPDQANLAAIHKLAERYDATIGYSDHTIGIRASVLAVATGARIIEKHFTLDNNHSSFRDHQLSADVPTMRRLVEEIREAECLLGSGVKDLQPDEKANLVPVRRSIVAARDLPAGHTLTPADLTWKRPGGGVPPGREALLLGRRLVQAVQAGAMLLPTQLAPE